MSYIYEALSLNPDCKNSMGRNILAWFTTLSVLIWSLGVPLGVLIPLHDAFASAPIFTAANLKWKSTSTKVLIDFTQPVFNSTLKQWGPPGKLDASDFTITGTGAPVLSSVQHDGGSRYAVLTFASAPPAATTIACAATSIYDEGVGGTTPVACSGSSVTLSAVTEDSTAPTVSSVNVWGKNSFEVRFSEHIDSTTGGSRANYKLTTAATTDAYDGTATLLAQDGTVQDAYIWVQDWDPSVVMFDVWDATVANNDTLAITTSVTDIFGNAVASQINQALLFAATGAGGSAMSSPQIESVFLVSATSIDIVFSKAMNASTTNVASFYTLTTAAADNTAITSATLQANTKVVRVVASGATIVATDFMTNPNATPDTIKVCTAFCPNGGPKDTDNNTQMTEWDRFIEAAPSPKVDHINIATNGDVRIFTKMVVDPATVQTTDFTFKRAGTAISGLTVSDAYLDWDKRTIIARTTGAAVDDGVATTAETLEILTTNNVGPADIFGTELIASANNIPCAAGSGIIDCAIDTSKPLITKAVHTDVNANGAIDKLDTVDIYFSENIERFSAFSPWDFELLYGANCAVTKPTDPRTNCNWGYWGDSATLNWDLPTTANTNVRITVGGFPDVKAGYLVVPWSDPYGFGGVHGADGNNIGNIGIVAVSDTSAPTISSIRLLDIGAGNTGTLGTNDRILLTFSEAMDQTTVTSTTTLALNANAWGNSTTSWAGDGKSLTIYIASGSTAATGNIIDPASTVTDLNGNAVPASGNGSTATIPTLGTGPTLVTGAGGSAGNTKLYLKFSEAIANTTQAYPGARKTLPNNFAAVAAALAPANFAFTGTAQPNKINFISADGKEVILNMSAAVVGGNTLNLTGGAIIGSTTGAVSTVNNTLTNLSVALTDTTGPTITSLKPVTAGTTTFDPSKVSTSVVSGDKIIVEFSESVDPGSFFNLASQNAPALALDAALVIAVGTGACGASGCTWGDGASVTLLTHGSIANGKAEITLGVPGTGKTLIANGNTVAPTGITDYVGNVGAGTPASINTTAPSLTSIKYVDVDTSATVNQNDTVAFLFNTAMDASVANFGANTDSALWVEICTNTGCTKKTWGSGVATAWSNSNKTLTVTLGATPTIAAGNQVWFEHMFIKTASSGSIFRPGILDFSGPVLSSAQVNDVNSSGTLNVGDIVLFRFSEEMDQATVNASNLDTRMVASGSAVWGASPTVTWLSSTILQVTIANAPATVPTFGTTTVNPAAAVTDINGNADATQGAGPILTALTIGLPTSVVLADTDTTSPGIDGNDIKVTWVAPSVGTVNHYRVYILPPGVGLNIATHYQINSTPIVSSTTTFNAKPSSTSAYQIYDDSRFNYQNPGSNTNFFPLFPDKQYIAYVVACGDATCSTSSFPGGSAPTSLIPDFQNFGGTGGMGPMPTMTPTIMGGGTAFVAGGGMGSGLPFVEGTLPFQGAVSVPINIKMMGAKFSEPLDQATITASTFSVQSDATCDGIYEGTVAGSLSYISEHSAIILTPTANLTASACFQFMATVGIKSTFGTPLGMPYFSKFQTGASADSSAPSILDNKFTAEGINTASVDPTIPEIGVRFGEDMNPALFTSSTVTLAAGSVPISSAGVDYDPFSRVMHFWLGSALLASTAHTLTLDGAAITDLSGNPLGASCTGCTVTFTTGALSTTAPKMNWADGDGFHVSVGFSASMKEATVTDSANWRLTDSTGAEVSLTGKNFFYDAFSKELHIDGLALTSGAAYTIAVRQPANAVKGLNGVAMDVNFNSLALTAHAFAGPGAMACGFNTFDFGCGMDNALNVNVMMFMPINVWPDNNLAGQTSKYFVDIPITQAINNGGKIILAFPVGFDVSNAAPVPITEAWLNNDLNGPGPNKVTFASAFDTDGVKANSPTSGSIEIQLAIDGTGSTSAKDFLSLDLKGIKNSLDASAIDFARGGIGGYTVTLSTKDATGKTLDSNLKSMPFPINKAGNGRIAGTVKDSSGKAVPSAVVFLDSPRGGHMEFTTDASGNFTFSGLPVPGTDGTANDTIDYWLFVQPPQGQGFMGGAGFSIGLSDETAQVVSKTITVTKGTLTISGTITHAAALGGKEVQIFANGPTGWTDKKVTLASAASTAYSITVGEGDWNVGVNMWVPPDMFGGGQFVQSTNFMPPPSRFVSVAGANVAGIDFALSSLASTDTITGKVTDNLGNNLSGVDVWAHSSGFNDAFARTQPDGTYTLFVPKGTYTVGVGNPGLKSPPEVQVIAPKANVNFTMKKGTSSIKGSILDDAGNPIKGAGIGLFNATTKEFIDASTNDSGYYTAFADAGTWKVEARHPQFGLIPTASTTISGTSAGSNSYSAVLTANSAASGYDFTFGSGVTMRQISGFTCSSFSGSACASGKVVGDVTVTAIEITTATGNSTGRSATVTTNAFDGSYTIKVPANASTARYTLKATTKYGPLKEITGINVASANSTGNNWTVADAVPVTIKINNIPATYENDTAKIDEAVINFFDSSSGKEKTVFIDDATAVSGTASWTTKVMPSNQYDVKAYIPGFGEISPVATSTTNGVFKVTEGTPATLEFNLTKSTMTIGGTVTDSVSSANIKNAWVTVSDNITGLGYQIETETDGTFTIEVPTGTYSLEVGESAHKDFQNATNITANTTNLAISMPPTGSTITGTVYEANGTTVVEQGYVYAEELGGTGTAGAPIVNGAFTLDVDSGTTWDLQVKSESGYEENTAVRVVAGATATVTANDQITEFTATQELSDSVTPSSGKTIDDTANNDVELNLKPQDIGSGATTKSITIESDPPIHEFTGTSVFGDEKSVEVNGGKESRLDNAIDFTVMYDKADVDSMITDAANDVDATNVDDKIQDLQLAFWDDEKGSGGDWVDAPTIKRVQVDAAGDSLTAFAPETFSTFVTNIGANSNFYTDYKIELITATPHMTVWGAQTESDSTPPAIPAKPTVASGASSITIDWTAYSAPTDILEYEVYRTTSGSIAALNGQACLPGIMTVCQANQTTVTAKSFTDTQVQGQIYYYAITAVDKSHNGDAIGRLSPISNGVTIGGGSGGGGGGGGGSVPPPAEPTPIVTPAPAPAPTAVSLVDVKGSAIIDGDLIKTATSFDIYIVKLIGAKKFKRLILNPAIFNSYGHLKWGNVKTVTQTVQDAYTLADLVIEVNPDGSVFDPKVYKVSSGLNTDVGQRQWLNMTAAQFTAKGYDWDSIYHINHTEAGKNFYPLGTAITP